MTEHVANPIISLKDLDFRVIEALTKASSPPFLGLLEFSDEDRAKARESICNIGDGSEQEIERVLRQYQNFATWYICDTVRRLYGMTGTHRVWPYIAEALGIRSELSHPFRHTLHQIVSQRCGRLGLPVPTEGKVNLFRLHAGVSDAQLPQLIRAFLLQERHFGPPNLDDGNALNEWEDYSLDFLHPGLRVPRIPILWDASAWHALVYAECRLDEGNENKTVYHTKFAKIIKEVQDERAASPARVETKARPRLVLDNLELSIRLPDGTSRQLVQFDDDPSLRVRPSSVIPLPYPLPSRVSFGEGVLKIDILPNPGDVFVGDADLEGDIIQVRQHKKLSMTNIIIFAREPIKGRDVTSYEVAEGLFTTSLALPQTETLELLVGETPVGLTRQLYRRVSLKGGIIGRGPSGPLYSPEATVLIRTGIATETQREISVNLGAEPEEIFNFQTDISGEAEIPLNDILPVFGDLHGPPGPVALRVELLRPKEDENAQAIGTGIRMRADIWPEFLERKGFNLRCSLRPSNWAEKESRNILVDQADILCIDRKATSEAEIAFEIESKLRRYRLPPNDLNIIHIRPDGTTRPWPIGSPLILTSATRGGALRFHSNDSEAALEIPDHSQYRPFRGGRASTVALRGLKPGWIRLHRQDGVTIDLAEIREEFAYSSVSISRQSGNVQISLNLDGKIDALRVEVEGETGEGEIGDIHFGAGQFLDRPPEWVSATLQPTGCFEIVIDGYKLSPSIGLGRLYVKDQAGWHPIVSAQGDLLTFVSAHGDIEPESDLTEKRCKRVLGWLDIRHASESRKEGEVDAILAKRKSSLVKHLDTIPGGRSKLLDMSLNDDWFVAGSTWMPSMQTLLDRPDIFEASIANFHNVGGAFECLSQLENRPLRDLDFIDPLAFAGFSNAASAQETGEELQGFDAKRLMQIVSLQEGGGESRWNGSPVLGPTHWRAAHMMLQDRIEETRFFGDDVESNNGKRSLNLRRLHGLADRNNEKIQVPSFLEEDQKIIHEDCSQTLQDFAVAARSQGTLSWLSSLETKFEFSSEILLKSLEDLVRLGPELFAFHLIAAELERRNS